MASTRFKIGLAAAWFTGASMCVSAALADPLPARDFLKFEQLPMKATAVDGAIYYGHDERSTIYGSHTTGQYGVNSNGTGQPGTFVADDFADKQSSDVLHVKWWGSYHQNNTGNAGVQKFLIAFESDVPAVVGNPFSYPGTPLVSQVVSKGPLSPSSGTFSEKLLLTGAPEDLYEYNAELLLPFHEQKDTVYWLKIVALIDPSLDGNAAAPMDWGWHTRDYTIQDTLASAVPSPGENVEATTIGGTQMWHFQDDAVRGGLNFVNVPIPAGPQPTFLQDQPTFQPLPYLVNIDYPADPVLHDPSLDLAFALYTYNPPISNVVPEPSTLALLGLGAVGLAIKARRRRAAA